MGNSSPPKGHTHTLRTMGDKISQMIFQNINMHRIAILILGLQPNFWLISKCTGN